MRYPGTSYPWSTFRFPYSILPDHLWCWVCFNRSDDQPLLQRMRAARECARRNP